jgi:hypothetical protein
MNTRKMGRWAAAMGAIAALAGAQALVQVVGATPASAAVPGLQVVSVTGAFDSANLKEVTAFCPAGKRVIGTGFHLLGGQGDVILDDVRPQADRVTVSAGEDQDGTTANWKITALAVCAFAPSGLEIVTVTSSFGPSTSKGATASCPSGKQVIGTGAALTQGFGQISIGNLVMNQNSVSAFGIDDEDGFSGGWSVTAYAICAFPLPGLQIVGGASPFDSSTQKLASANCPTGKKATGLGWGMGGGGEAHINFAGIGDTGITLVANEDDNGFSGNWQMNPVVICASA